MTTEEKMQQTGNDTNIAQLQKQAVASGYDLRADVYKTLFTMHPSPVRVRWTESLASSLPPGAHVLELGCGNGIPSVPFLTHGCTLTGVDISAAQIALAQKVLPGATLLHKDMMSLDFDEATFDAISSMYAIPHLPMEEQGEMLKRISGWLKPGGVLVLNFPAEVSPEEQCGVIEFMGENMYWKGIGVEGTRRLLGECATGMRIVEEEVAEEDLPEDREGGPVTGGEHVLHWIKLVKESI